MATSLPPDPYKALGVNKESKLAEIRSAHRKLVLKCHPDKVQDAALKAVKQDEFQQVQQAYELLSDETKRAQYDELVVLFALRNQMGRGNPTARSNPFEYEVRNAEPRKTSTTSTRPSATSTRPSPTSDKPGPRVYSQPQPRSYEDILYEEPRSAPRKSTNYESADRKRGSAREDERERERRRYEDEEKIRQKAEKESKRSAHSEKKKSRDKDRRRGTEEKTRTRTTAAYVEEDSDESRGPQTRSSEKKSSRHKMEEEIRQREDDARAQEAATRAYQPAREHPGIKPIPLDAKWDEHMEYAGKYMQAARRKVGAEDDFSRPSMPHRADTFAAPSPTYNIRYATPRQQYSDDDSPRRSSARKEGRRSSETTTPRTRAKSSGKTPRHSPPTHPRDPRIVEAPFEPLFEPPSPPSMAKKPTLQHHSSAPPLAPVTARKEPSRAKTQDYPRADANPPLTRAQTFQSGDGGRERGGSRLKKTVDYDDDDSDYDDPVYSVPHKSHSPSPRERRVEQTRYFIDNGKTVPIIKARSSAHRSELRNLDIDNEYIHSHERSESPRGTPSQRRRSSERPPVSRQSSDRPRAIPIHNQPSAYYAPPPAPEPIVRTVRPKVSREGSGTGRRGGSAGGPFFGEIKYAQPIGPDQVIYATHAPSSGADPYRRGSDPNSHQQRDYSYPTRGRGEQVY